MRSEQPPTDALSLFSPAEDLHFAVQTTAEIKEEMPLAICSSLAINKQWLSEAIPVYLQNTTFYFDKPGDLTWLCIVQSKFFKNNMVSISVCYPQALTERDPYYDLRSFLSTCPRLKNVKIQVGKKYYAGFEAIEDLRALPAPDSFLLQSWQADPTSYSRFFLHV